MLPREAASFRVAMETPLPGFLHQFLVVLVSARPNGTDCQCSFHVFKMNTGMFICNDAPWLGVFFSELFHTLFKVNTVPHTPERRCLLLSMEVQTNNYKYKVLR